MTTSESSPARRDVDIAIIGAGIGGVAAAVGLHRAGFHVDVYDQAPEFREVGGTITIDAYSFGILENWCVGAEVIATAVPCHGIELRTMAGQLINWVKLPGLTDLGVDVPDRTDASLVSGVQRSDLHGSLLRYLPPGAAHPGMRLTSVADRGTHAEAVFEDGTVIKPQVLIGADGIRSTVRRLFTDVEARATEAVICRSLASSDQLPEGWPNDRLRRWEHLSADGSSVNALFAPTRAGTQIGIDTSLYGGDQLLDLEDEVVPIERLLAVYPPDADPVVTDALRAGLVTTRAYRLYDLPEVPVWTSDRVALLGDAAHAMRPLLGQGANQAIQDAGELVASLLRERDIPSALAAYERARAPFTAAIQRAARTFKPHYQSMLAGAESQAGTSEGRAAVRASAR